MRGACTAATSLRKLHDNAFLTTSFSAAEGTLAVVILNGIGLGASFENVWQKAKITICADGGANILYDRYDKCNTTQKDRFIPQYIKGDLDSIRDDVAMYYKNHGTQVMQDPDQNSNDLDKCLVLLQSIQSQYQKSATLDSAKLNVLILGAMGGRFDQEMQNINALFRW